MKVVTIPKELCTYLELLHYETEALQDLIVRMAMTQDNISDEIGNYWTNRYVEKYTEYNIAKRNLENTYVKPEIEATDQISWNLNFDSCEVIIQ